MTSCAAWIVCDVIGKTCYCEMFVMWIWRVCCRVFKSHGHPRARWLPEDASVLLRQGLLRPVQPCFYFLSSCCWDQCMFLRSTNIVAGCWAGIALLKSGMASGLAVRLSPQFMCPRCVLEGCCINRLCTCCFTPIRVCLVSKQYIVACLSCFLPWKFCVLSRILHRADKYVCHSWSGRHQACSIEERKGTIVGCYGVSPEKCKLI